MTTTIRAPFHQRRFEEQLQQIDEARAYRRTLAVLQYCRGQSVLSIAQALCVSRQSVHNWIREYQQSLNPAQLLDKPREGRPPVFDAAAFSTLERLMKTSPDQWGYSAVNWTGPLLSEQLKQLADLECSSRTVRRALHQMGYVWKRFRYVLAPDPDQEKKSRLLREIEDLPPRSVLLGEDETELLLFPPLRAGWAKQGEPAHVPINGYNRRRVVFGTMNLRTGHRLFCARRSQKALDFQHLLQQVHRSYRSWQVALLIEGDPSHTAVSSVRMAEQLGMRLLWLPKRCPHLNPLERLWQQGKEIVSANKQYQDLDQQVDRCLGYLKALSNEQALQTAGVWSEDFWLASVVEKTLLSTSLGSRIVVTILRKNYLRQLFRLLL